MTSWKGYLLDTNVVSEPKRPRPNPAVVAVLHSISKESYLSVLTVGELRRGAFQNRSKHPQMTDRYSTWIDAVEAAYKERLLPIDNAVASLWGQLSADRPRAVIDTLLAATAIVHDLTLVTRNVVHVQDLPVKLLNPWSVT